MARPPSKHPTQLELEILKILWRDGPATVREVRDALAEFRELAYTSVMTVMNIMTRKKYLRRKKQAASYVYQPTVSEEAATSGMLQDLLDRAFDGSAVALMQQLFDTADLDDDELDRIRELIRKKRGERPQDQGSSS